MTDMDLILLSNQNTPTAFRHFAKGNGWNRFNHIPLGIRIKDLLDV